MRMTVPTMKVLAALKALLPDCQTEIFGQQIFHIRPDVLVNSIYPILHRLEGMGWLVSRKGEENSMGSHYRYYSWTQKGYDAVREPELSARIAPYAVSR